MDKLANQSNDLTPEPVFKPTPHMIVWLDTAIRLQTESITEIELESKITAQSWYNWIKNPIFVQWFNKEWENKIKVYAFRLDIIGIKNARKDFNFWKAMQQRVGRFKEEPSKVGTEFSEEAKRIRIIVTNGGQAYKEAVAKANYDNRQK